MHVGEPLGPGLARRNHQVSSLLEPIPVMGKKPQ